MDGPDTDADRHREASESHPVAITSLTTVEELATVKAFWSANAASVNADFDSFLVSLKARETVAGPHVLVLSRRGEPVALALGRRVRRHLSWKLGYIDVPPFPVEHLEFPSDGLIGVYDEAAATVLLGAVDAALAATGLPFAKFKSLDVTHPVHRALAEMAHTRSRDPVSETAVHWRLDLPASFDAYYQSRTKNVKNNIKTYRNRARKAFGEPLTLTCLRRTEDVEQAIRIAEQLTAKTYQRGLGVGFADTPQRRESWRLAAERGWLRVYVLEMEGKPVAYWAGPVYEGVFTVDFTSFDPEYSHYHPGQLALLSMIEEFCADPLVRQIDFGYGEAAYKSRFGSWSSTDANVIHFARSARGQAWRAVRMLVSGSHRMVRSALERWNLLDRLRTGWRTLARKTRA